MFKKFRDFRLFESENDDLIMSYNLKELSQNFTFDDPGSPYNINLDKKGFEKKINELFLEKKCIFHCWENSEETSNTFNEEDNILKVEGWVNNIEIYTFFKVFTVIFRVKEIEYMLSEDFPVQVYPSSKRERVVNLKLDPYGEDVWESKINEKYVLDKTISNNEIASMLTLEEIDKIIENGNYNGTIDIYKDTRNSVTDYLKENFSGWVKLSSNVFPKNNNHYHVTNYRFRSSFSSEPNLEDLQQGIYIKIIYDRTRTRISSGSNRYRENLASGSYISFWVINENIYDNWSMSTLKEVASISNPELDPYGEDDWDDDINESSYSNIPKIKILKKIESKEIIKSSSSIRIVQRGRNRKIGYEILENQFDEINDYLNENFKGWIYIATKSNFFVESIDGKFLSSRYIEKETPEFYRATNFTTHKSSDGNRKYLRIDFDQSISTSNFREIITKPKFKICSLQEGSYFCIYLLDFKIPKRILNLTIDPYDEDDWGYEFENNKINEYFKYTDDRITIEDILTSLTEKDMEKINTFQPDIVNYLNDYFTGWCYYSEMNGIILHVNIYDIDVSNVDKNLLMLKIYIDKYYNQKDNTINHIIQSNIDINIKRAAILKEYIRKVDEFTSKDNNVLDPYNEDNWDDDLNDIFIK